MIQFLALLAAPILNLPVIRRVRRNHGLEHATIHILSRKVKNLSMAGRSTMRGFYLYGNVATARSGRRARGAQPHAQRRAGPRDPDPQLRHRAGDRRLMTSRHPGRHRR